MNWSILIMGFCGGAIRGLVGFVKYQFSYQKVEFQLSYFLLMIFLSGIIGLLTAYIFNQNGVFSLIVGYAGGDFIENVYKTIKAKSSLYPEK